MTRLAVFVATMTALAGCAHQDRNEAASWDSASYWAVVVRGEDFVAWPVQRFVLPFFPEPAPAGLKWTPLDQLGSYGELHWKRSEDIITVYPLTSADSEIRALRTVRNANIRY